MDWEQVRTVRQELLHTTTLEEGVQQLMALVACPPGPAPLRALVVLRTGEAVQNVLSIPWNDQRQYRNAASATAWRALAKSDAPLVLSVPTQSGDRSPPAIFHNTNTQKALLQRDTTFLGLARLYTADSGMDGFLAVEYHARPQNWEARATVLELLSPLLSRRQSSPPQDTLLTDPNIPIAGTKMQRTLDLLQRFADTDEPLVLQGETGVGKTRLSRWVHERSRWADGPFQHATLHTVPEGLQLATLFGATKGAYTSADRNTPGLLQTANGGTLFVDEIDKLPLHTQQALLTLLDERRYAVLGSPQQHTANLRLVFGTNADLETLVQEGRFLEDLYYRINVLPVRVPSLRERPEDIVPWAYHIADTLHRRDGTCTITPRAQQRLKAHPWPGNLRQLTTVIKRIHAMIGPAPTIDLDALEQALSLDRSPRQHLPTSPIQHAARGIVAGLQANPGQLDFGLLKGFSGVVLQEAIIQCGTEEGLTVLGEAHRLNGDNHHKFIKRERTRANQLLEALRELITD